MDEVSLPRIVYVMGVPIMSFPDNPLLTPTHYTHPHRVLRLLERRLWEVNPPLAFVWAAMNLGTRFLFANGITTPEIHAFVRFIIAVVILAAAVMGCVGVAWVFYSVGRFGWWLHRSFSLRGCFAAARCIKRWCRTGYQHVADRLFKPVILALSPPHVPLQIKAHFATTLEARDVVLGNVADSARDWLPRNGGARSRFRGPAYRRVPHITAAAGTVQRTGALLWALVALIIKFSSRSIRLADGSFRLRFAAVDLEDFGNSIGYNLTTAQTDRETCLADLVNALRNEPAIFRSGLRLKHIARRDTLFADVNDLPANDSVLELTAPSTLYLQLLRLR